MSNLENEGPQPKRSKTEYFKPPSRDEMKNLNDAQALCNSNKMKMEVRDLLVSI